MSGMFYEGGLHGLPGGIYGPNTQRRTTRVFLRAVGLSLGRGVRMNLMGMLEMVAALTRTHGPQRALQPRESHAGSSTASSTAREREEA